MANPTTASLFGDCLDPGTALVAVLGRGRPSNKPTSKAQQAFARLAAKIELKREQLRHWQAYIPRYNQRLAAELQPLRSQLLGVQRQIALEIDRILTEPRAAHRLRRMHYATLRQLLQSLLAQLMQHDADESLLALNEKYADHEQERWQRAEEQEQAEAEAQAQAQAQAQERVRIEEPRAQARHGARAQQRSRQGHQHSEAGAAAHAQARHDVSQALRDVYRKLVSALHPDREPDPDARERKTRQMQQVNLAYDASDLLTLLGLQLEIEQIDATHLSSVPPQRLTHYNQILREQLAGVESELELCLEPFREMGFGNGRALTVLAIERQLSADIAQLRGTVRELRQDLAAFRDPRALQRLLERYELEAQILEEEIEDAGELAELFNMTQPPARGPRRRTRR